MPLGAVRLFKGGPKLQPVGVLQRDYFCVYEIGDVERMFKAMIKFLEQKHLNPEPFLTSDWEKNLLTPALQ